MNLWRRWLGYFLPEWPRMGAALLCALLCELSATGLMALSAWLIASAALQPPFHTLSLAVVGVRVCGLSRAALRYAERYISHDATFRILRRLRVGAYERLEALAPRHWETRLRAADSALLLRQVDTLKDFYLRALSPVATALLASVVLAAAFTYYVPALAGLLFLAFFCIGILIPGVLLRRNAAALRRAAAKQDVFAARCHDALQGIEELTAYGRSPQALQEVAAMGRAAHAGRLRVGHAQALGDALAEAAGTILLLAGLCALLVAARAQTLTGVQFAVCALALQQGLVSLYALPGVWHFGEEARRVAGRFFALPAPPPAEAQRKARAFPAVDTLLTAECLSFAYEKERPVLRGISFALRRGERVAIVGSSGAGKSTLLKLLLGLYADWEGALYLQGISYKDVLPAEICAQFRVVPQETHVFHRSIAENLRIVCPNASEAQMLQALRMAGLGPFVAALPQGLCAIAGEDGCKFSGGQRQRLAIARALLAPAPILLLDEPTAGLDQINAAALFRTIEALPGVQALLLVTHALEQLVAMDRILVLEDGRIAEVGSFAELIAARGIFWRMLQARC